MSYSQVPTQTKPDNLLCLLKAFLHELNECKLHSLAPSCPHVNECDGQVKALRLVSVTHWQASKVL